MTSSNDELYADGDDAIAESVNDFQSESLNDIREIHPQNIIFFAPDISTSTVADTLTSDYTFQEGQIIVVNVLGTYTELVLDSENLSSNVVDTISITAGEIPNEVFILPSAYVNTLQLIFNSCAYDKIGDRLICSIKYDNITIPYSRKLVTRFEIPNAGSSIKQFVFDMVETKLESTVNNLTSESTELISDSGNITDPYKVYDGLDSNALTVMTDSNGDVDIFHTYQFATGTQVMSFKMKCALAINSPTVVTLYGSHDNIDFDELLVMNQNIVIDDYTINKRIDITKYDTYTYYKVHITKGTPDTNIIINEYYLMTEV